MFLAHTTPLRVANHLTHSGLRDQACKGVSLEITAIRNSLQQKMVRRRRRRCQTFLLQRIDYLMLEPGQESWARMPLLQAHKKPATNEYYEDKEKETCRPAKLQDSHAMVHR
jgi:hypothetical protein